MANNVAENIKNFRIKKALTQKQLGELLGVSAQMIGQYETGIRNPKPTTLRKIAAALGIPEDKLHATPEIDNETMQHLRGINHMDTQGLVDSPVVWVEMNRTRMNAAFDRMNEQGQEIAADRIEELSQIPAYQKKEKDN